MKYDPLLDEILAGSDGLSVVEVTPVSGVALVSPVAGNLYVVSSDVTELDILDFDTAATGEWGILFKFSSSASAATVMIALQYPHTTYETVGDWSFAVGEAYVISCVKGMLTRGKRTEVTV